MDKMKCFPFSLRSLLKKEASVLKPVIEFSNALDTYKIRIVIPESKQDSVSLEVKESYADIDTGCSRKKIYFSEPANISHMKSYYSQGALNIEIPKAGEEPHEKINRLALSYM